MREKTGTKVLWWVAGVVIVLYCLIPVVWIISLSFKDQASIADKKFFPEDPSWTNYDFIINGDASELFLPALRNSFGITLIATSRGRWSRRPRSTARRHGRPSAR